MTNILTVLPDFDTSPYTHILPSLEKALVSTADLLTLDAVDIAKRAQVPPGEVKKLADALLNALHTDAPADDAGAAAKSAPHSCVDVARRWATISTLDDDLDHALGGGIALGQLTEIVGESAAGKTQLLLTLLLAAQLPSSRPRGSEQRSALYISTEAPLSTARLTQILKKHPKLSDLSVDERPSLNRIHSTHIHDLEAQEHIIRYQVPVAIQKHNVGLLVIDSIAANYRAEFDKGRAGNGAESMAKRSIQLVRTGALLQNIARTYNVAVVVANQVADRFLRVESTLQAPSQATQGTRQGSPAHSIGNTRSASTQPPSTFSVLSTDDPLALDHQQRFFTGWGDDPSITNIKTPSLGLVWTNQLATRIALLKEPVYEDKIYAAGDERNLIGWTRSCKVVFSAWCGEGNTVFEIWEGGIRSISSSGRPGVDEAAP
ncbi:related to RAD57 protein [Ramularia collo-cygni]|uniref:Related to RAD57 protein n=1 Tax=Ramularia collo-cygni TaxID=112498 RepID=A0A2D3UTP8_9PEZI|nr:related to RAD57 protein [Ramularia collo-cygni]CZT19851.1 related to RAD57 protein [Ramularia collo-cygni]